ncbi:alpha/beta fold hydrolase [Streptomyces sp. NPDC003016]
MPVIGDEKRLTADTAREGLTASGRQADGGWWFSMTGTHEWQDGCEPTREAVGTNGRVLTGAIRKRRVVVQGLSTLYLDAGHGPVVFLVHGNATSVWAWQDIMAELSSTHRVVALALPGYGDTSPLDDVHPPQLIRFMASFLDELGIREVIAVGHSLGGLLVAQFALAHPDRVRRLVLADSAGLGRSVGPRVIATALTPRPVGKLVINVLLMPGGGLLSMLNAALGMRQPWRVPCHTWLAQLRLSRSRTLLETSYESVRLGNGPAGQRARYSLVGRLNDIRVPTLIIWGLTDEIYPVWQAVAAQRQLPHGRLAVIVGAGHPSLIECHEEFMDALGPFVRDERQPA